jgi:hypothetical protein
MKSKKVTELINWLSENTVNIIDLPMDFSPETVRRLVDISEHEMIGEDISERIREFKKNWYEGCVIKSKSVEKYLSELSSNISDFDSFKLSESEVIKLVEMSEDEI